MLNFFSRSLHLVSFHTSQSSYYTKTDTNSNTHTHIQSASRTHCYLFCVRWSHCAHFEIIICFSCFSSCQFFNIGIVGSVCCFCWSFCISIECHVKYEFLYMYIVINLFFISFLRAHSDASMNLSFNHRLQAKLIIIAFYVDNHYL